MINIGGISRLVSTRIFRSPDRIISGPADRPVDIPKMTDAMIQRAGWIPGPGLQSWGDGQGVAREQLELHDAMMNPKQYLSDILQKASRHNRTDATTLTMYLARTIAEDISKPFAYHSKAVELFSGLCGQFNAYNMVDIDLNTVKGLALCNLHMQAVPAKSATLLFSLPEPVKQPILEFLRWSHPGQAEEFIELIRGLA